MGYLYEDKIVKAQPIVDKLNDRMRYEGDPSFCAGLDFAIQLLRNAESCEQSESDKPEIRHGQWIAVSSFDAYGGDEEAWIAHGNPTAYHYCSKCKNEAYVNEEGEEILSDFCPFCGIDTREEGADNG